MNREFHGSFKEVKIGFLVGAALLVFVVLFQRMGYSLGGCFWISSMQGLPVVLVFSFSCCVLQSLSRFCFNDVVILLLRVGCFYWIRGCCDFFCYFAPLLVLVLIYGSPWFYCGFCGRWLGLGLVYYCLGWDCCWLGLIWHGGFFVLCLGCMVCTLYWRC